MNNIHKKVGPMNLPILTNSGKMHNLKLYLYRFKNNRDYYVVEKGLINRNLCLLVRIQSACSFGIILSSQRCDCQEQFYSALEKIASSKVGILIYAWPHEGRGVGMWNHVRVYMEQDKGEDTVTSYQALGLPVDARDYSDIIKILQLYKLKKVQLLTNNPKKIEAVRKSGIEVIRVPLLAHPTRYNINQLKVKKQKLGHLLNNGYIK